MFSSLAAICKVQEEESASSSKCYTGANLYENTDAQLQLKSSVKS